MNVRSPKDGVPVCDADRVTAPDVTLGRRGFLAFSGGAALGALCLKPGPALAALPSDRAFRIFRKGEEIGIHRVSFEASGDRIISRVDVEITVKVAFVTAFSFRQRGEDHWRDGMLVRSSVKTDDDGDVTRVEIEEGRGKLHVDGPSGTLNVPLGMMTDTSFWNADILRQSQVISAGKGDLEPIRSTPRGEDLLDLGGKKVRARHFEIASSSGRGGDIWYDPAGRWVKSTIRTRGEVLDYQLIV